MSSKSNYEFTAKNYNKLVDVAKKLFSCDHAGADKKKLWDQARSGDVDLVTIESDWRAQIESGPKKTLLSFFKKAQEKKVRISK